MGEINFTNYNKITDTVVYLDKDHSLKFCVSLISNNQQTNQKRSFHSEYQYISNNGDLSQSILRNINCYFTITTKNSFKDNIILRAGEVYLLNKLIDNVIIPLYSGKTCIFKEINRELKIVGKYNPERLQFIISDYNYIGFLPIAISFEDGTYAPGIRMFVNSNENYVDMTLDKFLEFYYILSKTDMYNAAIGLLTYVKTPPYNTNVFSSQTNTSNQEYDDNDWNSVRNNNTTNKNKKSFLDNF